MSRPIAAHLEARWMQPEMRSKFEDIFSSRNRDEWSKVFDGIDACVMPVLGLQEAASHPHNVARNLVAEGTDGTQHPNPAPHLSGTPATPGAFCSCRSAHRAQPGDPCGSTTASLRSLGSGPVPRPAGRQHPRSRWRWANTASTSSPKSGSPRPRLARSSLMALS